MLMPCHFTYDDFVPRFMRALFAPEDRVVLGLLPQKDVFINEPFARDDAIQALLQLMDKANIYFRASAHDGKETYGKANCVRVRAFYLDVDYGDAAHSKKSPFQTLDDAVGYLLTMPIRASVAWHTGHGVQAVYLLKEPYAFLAGGGDAQSMARYEAVSRKLSAMAMSDATFTPEHAFRVPVTLNDKRWKDPSLPVVRGKVLWMNEDQRYAFEEIETAVAGYDIEEHLAEEQKKTQAGLANSDEPSDESGKDIPFEELPEDIRNDIENVQADRSAAMFRIVNKMVRAGYGDTTIENAIRHGDAFQEKYAKRLSDETNRCIEKVRCGRYRYVYNPEVAPPIEISNESEAIHLTACAALPQALGEMLGRYEKACNVQLGQRVLDAARFHEHMFQSQANGVLYDRV